VSLNLDRSTWKRVAFGDAIDSVTDRVDDPSKAGVERYVGLEHLDPGVMTVQRWGAPEDVSAQKLLFEPGDVIFARRRAYQKKVARADFRGICSAHALVLRTHPEMIDPGFLPVFLSSNYFLDRAISISVGSLSPTVNWRDLRVQEFDLPPLDDQTRIADLLWALERRMTSLRDAEACTKVARSICGEAYFDSGRVNHVPLAHVATITSGITLGPSRRAMALSAPYLRVANVHRGRLDLDEIKEVGVTEAEAESKTVLREDVLVVEGHASSTEVGRAAKWDQDETPLFQNHLFRIRALNGYLPQFLIEALNSDFGQAYFNRVAKSTSGLNTINSTVLKAFPIPDWPLAEQEHLLETVSRFDLAIAAIQNEQNSLADCRSSLAVKLFESAN
jgi:restriction endonuclease S subunit